MQSVTFLVEGSGEQPYEVVINNEKKLSATCTCQADRMKTHCKHRTEIFKGNSSGILDLNAESLSAVLSWLPGSGIAVALQTLQTAEDAATAAKKQVDAAKKELVRAMRPE